MAQVWHFFLDGDDIGMMARAEGEGVVGDARRWLRPGDTFGPSGPTFDELKAAGGGTLSVDEDGYRLEPYTGPKVDPDEYPPLSAEELKEYLPGGSRY